MSSLLKKTIKLKGDETYRTRRRKKISFQRCEQCDSISNKIKKLSSWYRQKYYTRGKENSKCATCGRDADAERKKSSLRKGRDLFSYHD